MPGTKFFPLIVGECFRSLALPDRLSRPNTNFLFRATISSQAITSSFVLFLAIHRLARSTAISSPSLSASSTSNTTATIQASEISTPKLELISAKLHPHLFQTTYLGLNNLFRSTSLSFALPHLPIHPSIQCAPHLFSLSSLHYAHNIVTHHIRRTLSDTQNITIAEQTRNVKLLLILETSDTTKTFHTLL